jgi:general secretion pathway protein A
MTHKTYFGFKTEPFSRDIATKDLLKLPSMIGVKERFDYCLTLGGVMAVFGEVGSGKTTSIRWTLSHHHPSELRAVSIVANTGSIMEFYKQLAWGLDLAPSATSKAVLLAESKAAIREIASSKKQKVVVLVDEAQLLRKEVLAELHTVLNFDHDGANYLSLVLYGQTTLLDHLQYRGASPLASRVMTKAHVKALSQPEMEEYVNHHVRVAGVKKDLFDATAITAIHQGSAGGLRRANQLASGGLMAAALSKRDVVTAEHIRAAASELI